MPTLETHLEIVKPLVGGGTSLFAGILMKYLHVTEPIFAAASFGAIMAVIMHKKFEPYYAQGVVVPPAVVALFVSLFGGISACYGYVLLKPIIGLQLDQTAGTALLAFILVYFLPIILDVISNRIQGLKK